MLTTLPQLRFQRPDGFLEVTLDNGLLAVSVLPELGGKVSSLYQHATGREWLWKPVDFRGYFPNSPGDDFATGTLAGWDECFPTVAPCEWQGRTLPDHGEIWTAPCAIDEEALTQGLLRTWLETPLSPFRFERELELQGHCLIARYRLSHAGKESAPAEHYLWAMHPLFALQPGDRLEMNPGLRAQLPQEDWVDELAFPVSSTAAAAACAKTFATPASREEASVSLMNPDRGERLTVRWDPAGAPRFGLWLTRGGWHGHHHLALEPTHAAADRLDEAVALGQAPTLEAGASTSWEVTLSLASRP